jgi:predicted DNA-binding transcriptional regulator AlpA
MATDRLIPQRTLRDMFGGISDMTVFRWRQREILPPPVSINGRNFWRESTVLAIMERGAPRAQPESNLRKRR